MGKKAEIGKKLAAARQTFDEYASSSPEGSKFLDKILSDIKRFEKEFAKLDEPA